MGYINVITMCLISLGLLKANEGLDFVVFDIFSVVFGICAIVMFVFYFIEEKESKQTNNLGGKDGIKKRSN